MERVPPAAYGGTERVVYELVRQLVERGHDVTTFATADSDVPGHHVATAPRALRPAGITDNPLPWIVATAQEAIALAREGAFDIVHGHLEATSMLLAAACPVPVIATFHGRVDHPAMAAVFHRSEAHPVAISAHQAATRPEARWAAVIHNGLSLGDAPFGGRRDDSLVFVGRVSPEKGLMEAIDIARRAGRPLKIAAKVGPLPAEQAYYHELVRPALEAAGSDVEFLGELDGAERDRLVAASYATLMPGAWPEPFGLVAIESLACGTPVIARRVGALPEIIREGVDGFFGDDAQHMASLVDRVDELDRDTLRDDAIDRFNASRMTDDYERLMERLVAEWTPTGAASPETALRAARVPMTRIAPSSRVRPRDAGARETASRETGSREPGSRAAAG
jgi:glycosyltransferase involved in cell wall biosynthesis